jgi:putative DNA primase/helicase
MPSLALIFYLVKTVEKEVDPTGVDVQSTRQAIQWCDYLETHAKRLYASGEDPSMESARVLLGHIQNGDLPNGFSPRDVYHAKHWSKLDSADKVEEDLGWVRREIVRTPGRPSTKVILHPQLHLRQS